MTKENVNHLSLKDKNKLKKKFAKCDFNSISNIFEKIMTIYARKTYKDTCHSVNNVRIEAIFTSFFLTFYIVYIFYNNDSFNE